MDEKIKKAAATISQSQALQVRRRFAIVSLPDADSAAKRSRRRGGRKEVDEHRKTPHNLASLLLTNTTLRRT
ncbi:hypothetical protein, partial [Massilia sp. ZL223]